MTLHTKAILSILLIIGVTILYPVLISLFILLIVVSYFLPTIKITPAMKHLYLSSNKWKVLRLEVLLRDSYECQMCTSTTSLEVHHITYKHFTNESLGELVTVCRNCHQRIHNKYGYNYNYKFPLIKD